MKFKDIKVGGAYWGVLKTSIVNAEQKDYPEYLIHLTRGYVTSKGLQRLPGVDNGKGDLFVEIAGQRIKYTHVFETSGEAIEMAVQMMAELGVHEEPVDQRV